MKLSRMAEALGKDADAKEFEAAYIKSFASLNGIRCRFASEFGITGRC